MRTAKHSVQPTAAFSQTSEVSARLGVSTYYVIAEIEDGSLAAVIFPSHVGASSQHVPRRARGARGVHRRVPLAAATTAAPQAALV
jgi:hypothetical protein